MNRSNIRANTNCFQMILDACIFAISFVGDVLWLGRGMSVKSLGNMLILAGIFAIIFLLSNKEQYLYNVTMFYYIDRVQRKILKSFIRAFIATSAAIVFMPQMWNNRMVFFAFCAIGYILICIKSILLKSVMDNLEQKNAPRTAYVGNPEEFGKFNYYISKTSICIQQIGFIAMSREAYENASHEDYIGCVDDLEELIREHAIDQIYIMQNDEDDLRVTQRYVDLCIDMGVTVRLVVDFYKRRGADSYVSSVGTYPVITYHTVSLNTNEQLIKRMVDVFGGLVGILVFSPIMLIVAIAVKIDSPGPILFKQERAGQNGRKFKMYKFRSMYQDAEKRKQELMDQNEMNGELMFKMKEDPRITRVGKVIRKLSIDELPQFFNVLGGSMSLVGTRPPTMDEVEKYQKNHWRRISIKPGITGMWQVNGRSSIQDFNDVVELDVEYIDNWSLWLDLKIMVKTVFVVLGRSEAY